MFNKISNMCIFFAIMGSSYAENFYNYHEEGWFWYKERKEGPVEPTVTESIPEEKPVERPQELTLENAGKVMEEKQKRLEDLTSLAVLNPTEENVLNYMLAQKEVLDKSSAFARQWDRVLANNPELDTDIQTPISIPGQMIVKEEKERKRVENFMRLAVDHVLLVFTKEKCPYSDLMKRTIKPLAETFQILEISTDIEEPRYGIFRYEDMQQKFPLKATPTLVAFNTKTNQYTAIAVGTKPLDQILVQLEEALL